MKNNTRTVANCKPPDHPCDAPSGETETLCSDAVERIAVMLGVAVDLDDPEPALIAAVERAIAALVDRGQAPGRQ